MSELPVVDETAALIEQIKALAVVRGEVTLSSGLTADYYVDMRRVTLDGVAAPIVGRVMRDLVADLGVRRGRRPHPRRRSGGNGDAACGRCRAASGWTPSSSARQRRRTACNGGSKGRRWPGAGCWPWRTPATTGSSVLTAVEVLREAGAEVVGVAVIVDRIRERRRRSRLRGCSTATRSVPTISGWPDGGTTSASHCGWWSRQALP